MLSLDDAVTTKAEELEWMSGAKTSGQPDDFAYRVEDILFPTEDTAIVFGERTSISTTPEGAPCAHSYRSSNTLVRKEEGWHPVFSHVSGARCMVLEGR